MKFKWLFCCTQVSFAELKAAILVFFQVFPWLTRPAMPIAQPLVTIQICRAPEAWLRGTWLWSHAAWMSASTSLNACCLVYLRWKRGWYHQWVHATHPLEFWCSGYPQLGNQLNPGNLKGNHSSWVFSMQGLSQLYMDSSGYHCH